MIGLNGCQLFMIRMTLKSIQESLIKRKTKILIWLLLKRQLSQKRKKRRQKAKRNQLLMKRDSLRWNSKEISCNHLPVSMIQRLWNHHLERNRSKRSKPKSTKKWKSQSSRCVHLRIWTRTSKITTWHVQSWKSIWITLKILSVAESWNPTSLK